MHKAALIFVFSFLLLSVQSQILFADSIITVNESKKIIEYLASDSLKGRYTGTIESKAAAEFIANEFKRNGIKPIAGYDGYFMPFKVLNKNKKYVTAYNVLAGIQGRSRPNEIIIFSAHYDHIGTFTTNPVPSLHADELKKKEDSIYNGANDNASGIAALILLAQYFAALHNNERTLIFVAFSGEELGLLGSTALSDQVNADSTIAVINIEMIGRSAGKKKNPFITGAQLSNLRLLLNNQLAKSDPNFGKNFFANDPLPDEKLFYRSDNFPFVRFGIPAHTIMLTPTSDRYYHSVNDEIEMLDLNSMTKIIKAIALSVEGLIYGTATPDRIN